MNTQCQGHSLTFVQDHSHSIFSDLLSSETARPIEAKLYMEPQWDVGMKICSNVLGHLTMLIYGTCKIDMDKCAS